MKLYNTLTKKIQEFQPIQPGRVKMYSCGPTVYDHAHIGNLSSFIYADLLARVLKMSGLDVQRAMNITDVDDKTIAGSHAKFPELPPMEALKKLTCHFEEIFLSEMREVGNDTGGVQFIRATDSIEQIQNLIKKLLQSGAAYIADDGIYFDVAKDKNYGQLAKLEPPSLERSRVANDEYDKTSARDFALWKTAKPGEPSWGFVIDMSQPVSCALAGQARPGKTWASAPERTDGATGERAADGIGKHDFAGRPGWHIE
ncbi:MAG: class I tRNA ligase family protein, partial [Candidatus Nomurabacteria bacterium]|nr:class I tRNA ligase family protein [Candidatus Nomurabacteria bacterium]